MDEDHAYGGACPEEKKKLPDCYVIQTRTGEEALVMRFMSVITKDEYDEAFTPKKTIRRRRNGNWKNVIKEIFPGYIFVVTERAEDLFFRLKRVPKLSKLLCDGFYNFYHLTDNECRFIMKIGEQRGDHTFGISQILIDEEKSFKEGDRVRILSGDLKGFEGDIVYYDIHHRKAMVKTSLFGGTVIHVGVELIVKEG